MRRHVLTLTAVAGLAAIYLLTLVSPLARSVDQMAYLGRLDAGTALLTADRFVLASISVPTVALAILALAVAAYLRLGRSAAVRVAGSVLLTAGSAELLKRLLPAAPFPGSNDGEIVGGSFPSGHTAIVTAVALGFATVLGPKAARLMLGPLVAWVTVVAAATVAVGWHRPSDAVGGVLLAACWHAGLVGPRDAAGAVRKSQRSEAHFGYREGRRAALGWWVATASVISLAALVSPARADPAGREVSVLLYLAGLCAVFATSAVTLIPARSRLSNG